MSKRRKGKEAREGFEWLDRWVQLENRMTESAAWTSLSLAAIWIYIELRKQFDLESGGNEHLVLPYSAITWRLSRQTISKAFQELIEYGFIALVQQGGHAAGTGWPKKVPCVYRLSKGWEQKSRSIVDKSGREAIRLKLVKKATPSRIKNLEGHRTWEQ